MRNKNVIILVIASLFVLSAYAVSTASAEQCENTKDRLCRGVNDVFCGPVEIPDNLCQTNSKGVKLDGCNEKTRTGVERGLARIGKGIWTIATFWYSEPDAPSALCGTAPVSNPTPAPTPAPTPEASSDIK
jgi:hypothetical protein